MTHLPTTLVFSLVPCGLALASALVNARPVATLGRFTLGMALGIGIAAVYLLPAMTTQDNASLSVMTEGNGMYSNHFLFSTPERLSVFSDTFYEYAVAFARSMQTTLLKTTAIAACGVALAFLDTKESRRREDIFWLLTATVVSLEADDPDNPDTLSIKIAIDGLAFGGSASGFNASGSRKVSGINPKKLEDEVKSIVNDAFESLMKKQVIKALLDN